MWHPKQEDFPASMALTLHRSGLSHLANEGQKVQGDSPLSFGNSDYKRLYIGTWQKIDGVMLCLWLRRKKKTNTQQPTETKHKKFICCGRLADWTMRPQQINFLCFVLLVFGSRVFGFLSLCNQTQGIAPSFFGLLYAIMVFILITSIYRFIRLLR